MGFGLGDLFEASLLGVNAVAVLQDKYPHGSNEGVMMDGVLRKCEWLPAQALPSCALSVYGVDFHDLIRIIWLV